MAATKLPASVTTMLVFADTPSFFISFISPRTMMKMTAPYNMPKMAARSMAAFIRLASHNPSVTNSTASAAMDTQRVDSAGVRNVPSLSARASAFRCQRR